jgi:hypothetical protein
VRFGAYPNDLPARLSPVEWLRYEGHLGHQHVPNNHHGDPGAFKIALVIGIVAAPSAVRKRAAWSQRLGRVRSRGTEARLDQVAPRPRPQAEGADRATHLAVPRRNKNVRERNRRRPKPKEKPTWTSPKSSERS